MSRADSDGRCMVVHGTRATVDNYHVTPSFPTPGDPGPLGSYLDTSSGGPLVSKSEKDIRGPLCGVSDRRSDRFDRATLPSASLPHGA